MIRFFDWPRERKRTTSIDRRRDGDSIGNGGRGTSDEGDDVKWDDDDDDDDDAQNLLVLDLFVVCPALSEPIGAIQPDPTRSSPIEPCLTLSNMMESFESVCPGLRRLSCPIGAYCSDQTRSNPIKPDQTRSNPIKLYVKAVELRKPQ